jgi:hypothetical protein
MFLLNTFSWVSCSLIHSLIQEFSSYYSLSLSLLVDTAIADLFFGAVLGFGGLACYQADALADVNCYCFLGGNGAMHFPLLFDSVNF